MGAVRDEELLDFASLVLRGEEFFSKVWGNVMQHLFEVAVSELWLLLLSHRYFTPSLGPKYETYES